MRKKISIVLVLAMVLTMFNGFSYAETEKGLLEVIELVGAGKIVPGKELAINIFNNYLTSDKLAELEEQVTNYQQLKNGLNTDGLTSEKVRDLVDLLGPLTPNDLDRLPEIKEQAIGILGGEIVSKIVDIRGSRSNSDFAYDLISRIITKSDVVKYDTYTEKFTINFSKYKNDDVLKGYLSTVLPNAFSSDSIDGGLDTAQNVLTYILNDDADFNSYETDLRSILSGYALYSTHSSAPSPGGNSGGGAGGGSATTPTETPKIEEPKIENNEAKVELGKDSVEVNTGTNGQSVVAVKSESIKTAVESLVEAVKEAPTAKAVVTIKLDDVQTADMEVAVPKDAMTTLIENKVDLVIESKSLTYIVPADALTTALKDTPEDSYVEFVSSVVEETEVKDLIKDNAANKIAKTIEMQLVVKNNKGEIIKTINKFDNKFKIEIEIEESDGNPDLLAVFYINEETGALEFVGGKIKGNKIFISTDHYSKFAVVEYNKSFSDIENHWSKNYVQSMVAKHVVDGFTDVNLYKPEDQLTRAQFAKLIVETLEIGMVASKGEFTDVKSNHWAKDYIATAKQLGIVGGYEDGTFKPDQSITRAEMAVMLTNSLGLKKNANSIALNGFKDKSQIPVWAVEYMAPVVGEKLLVGSDGVLNPLGNVTRAEAATIIYRVYNR